MTNAGDRMVETLSAGAAMLHLDRCSSEMTLRHSVT
jgi:hypothetical protein